MTSLRGRIGFALGVFGLVTLLTLGGALWVAIRDLHQDAAQATLAELTVPYAIRGGQQMLLEALRERDEGERPAREIIEAFRNSQAGRRAAREFEAFVEETQEEIDEAGISIMLVQDGRIVVRSPETGEITAVDVDLAIEMPDSAGEVITGTTTLADLGSVNYAVTSIRAPRGGRVLPALMLLREDDSAELATADLIRSLTIAALVLLVIGIPMALVLSSSVTRPLRRLSEATGTVARGKVPEPLPTTGPLEVAEASAAFNAMAAEVGATREAQRQLLADIRHDLRTPLTVIGGFSEALRDGTASGDSAVRAAEAISDEAGRLERMLDDLDHLTVPGVAGPPLRLESIDSLELVRGAVERFAAEALSREQELVIADAAVRATLTADRDALDRILGNIIANALAHAPAPGGHVSLEATASADRVTLAVLDDGPGIPTAALAHVFDRFYRADPSRTNRGSGLGLAIVRDLAEALGGEVFAENDDGGGARVGVDPSRPNHPRRPRPRHDEGVNDTPQAATTPARTVRGRHGAVASPHHLATQAGMLVLRTGGSAVDAAIATNAALAVVAGYSCGLGGDAFWIIWDAERSEALTLNGSGRAGDSASIEHATAAGHRHMPERGPWSITVPGGVHSWGQAHARFGRLDWTFLLAPAIDLASGFPASQGWLDAIERSARIFGDDGDWAGVYRPHDRARRPGQIVRLPALESTLRRIFAEGPSAAYSGSVAAATAAYFEAQGVPISAEDLAVHTSDWARPLSIGYRDVTALSHPPNSVGVVALQTLGLLRRFPAPALADFDGRGWADPDWIHLGLEASRLGLAERDAHITDHAWMAEGETDQMLSSDHLDRLAGRIDPARTMPLQAGTLPAAGGTVYVTAADQWGNAVSLLESNYQGFGSGLVDPTTGIAFHDRGAFFRLDPGHPNALAPGKRPAHTLAPGMLLRNGRPWIVHGSMGGEIQPQVFAQFVSAVVDGGADVATAVAAPRWAAMMRSQHGPADLTELETRVHPGVPDALAQKGHDVVMRDAWASSMGHAHAIEIVRDGEGDVESLAAGCDPRSEGSAAAW